MEQSKENEQGAHFPDINIRYLPESCGFDQSRQLVWVIVGATGHFGSMLTRRVLEHGDLVAAVAINAVPRSEENVEWLQCDIRSMQQVQNTVEKVIQRFGKIDAFANASGIATAGAFEEQEDWEISNQIETNVIGHWNLLRCIIKHLRTNPRPGRIVTLSSTAGLVSHPGLAAYSATKWALEGLTESLSHEMDPFSVRTTLIQLGNAVVIEPTGHPDIDKIQRTHFDMKNRMPEYRGTPSDYGTVLASRNPTANKPFNERHAVSLPKAADIVWELVHCQDPPVRLALGTQAVDTLLDKMRFAVEEAEDWKFLSEGA
ncbi:hypothetical protein CANCADRAFT_2027 [Tortispora caseinolytica NRRL Y-17796]|uniref:Uncharacterized protein n=1 Tax=Tortispora caseinolytica NRRL Y-17796 TaxID=767744 RepID=A0A1E4TEW6_9ASCO|nr:hypothetical protein CANCADRAFT_2027 [Tortispora caseinolytica NRRL Y-17796]